MQDLWISKILSAGLAQMGYDVKMSEIHGMSQRGGNVSTQVRYGEKVDSPIVGRGQADVIVAFESMEALRWIEYLNTRIPAGLPILLDGISMGASTVLMAAGKKLPENVVGVLADCGFTTAREIICKVMRQHFKSLRQRKPITP